MARRATLADPQPAVLSQEQIRRGIQRLNRRLEQVREFVPTSLDRQDPWATVRPLSTAIEAALSETFGHGTVEYNRYFSASRFDWPIGVGWQTEHNDKIRHVSEDRLRSIQLLEAAVELLTDRLDGINEQPTGAVGATGHSNRIFIVHGHDSETKEAVARFVGKLGYEPVILHEQPNRGRTIIEKFREEAADIGFAVVLMSPDDETTTGAKRARQNVILELGFFLGKLGPKHVAALVRGDVETPSDFDGVVYTKVDDAGMWRMLLAKELKAAGYDIDMNNAL